MRRNRRIQFDGETYLSITEFKAELAKARKLLGIHRRQIRHTSEKLAYYKLRFGNAKVYKTADGSELSVVSRDQVAS